jgi:putative transposase
MAFDPEVHHRRSIRLSGYDYSESGAYFLTLCVRDMKPLFGRVAEGKMGLSPTGLVVQDCWLEIPRHFRQVELDEFVVMPNHLHGILLLTVGARHGVPDVADIGAQHRVPEVANVGAQHRVPEVANVGARHGVPSRRRPVLEQFGRAVSGSLATVIRLFKQAVTKRARALRVGAHHGVPDVADVGARHGVPLQKWQRNYYEHIIRDGGELGKIREYIATNPLRWACDRYNPERGVLVRDEAGGLVPWKDQT